MARKRLGKSSKVMLKIDNQSNDDIDAIEIFKPSTGGMCNPVKLYEDTEEDNEDKVGVGSSVAIVAFSILTVAVVGLVLYVLFSI